MLNSQAKILLLFQYVQAAGLQTPHLHYHICSKIAHFLKLNKYRHNTTKKIIYCVFLVLNL